MKAMKVTENSFSGTALAQVSVSGWITEDSTFPNVALEGKTELILDLNGVEYINSAGIRRWMTWMWNLEKTRPDMTITLERVPNVLVRQVEAVRHFVPEKAVFRSLYAAYFCESCDETAEPLLKQGVDYQNYRDLGAKGFKAPSVNCPNCKTPMKIESPVVQPIAKANG